jgi:threonine/homoserine/homoserine lactone efflux protein
MGEATPGSRLGFWGGIGFQWINPKSWASAMAMATTYLPPAPSRQGALIAAASFCAMAWLAQPVWIGFGGALRHLLSAPRTARLINLGLAVLLLASTLPFLLGQE